MSRKILSATPGDGCLPILSGVRFDWANMWAENKNRGASSLAMQNLWRAVAIRVVPLDDVSTGIPNLSS